jgi:Tol biopolymer transport system component
VSLLTELKRRKVFKVAAVYAVTAWLLIQITSTIESPLGLPDWSDTLIIVLLGVGFPIALIVSWAFDLTPEGLKATPPPTQAAPRAAGTHSVNIALQALVLVAVGFLVFNQYLRPAPEAAADASVGVRAGIATTSSVERTSILTPADMQVAINGWPVQVLAISPAGDTIAYVTAPRLLSGVFRFGTAGRRASIAIRRIDSRETERLSSDSAMVQPFFSPDGRWLGFFDPDGAMKKVLLASGSAPVTITDGLNGTNWAFAVWLDNGQIVFSTVSDAALYAVSAEGGAPRRVTSPPASQIGVRPTDFIPGTDIVLLSSVSQRGDSVKLSLESLDLATGERKEILDDASMAHYLPSGHLVFQRGETTLVAPFDPVSQTLTGSAIPLTDRVNGDTGSGNANGGVPQLAVARSGALAYLPAQDDRAGELVIVERDGTATRLGAPTGNYDVVSVSADGARAVVAERGSGELPIQVYDFARGDIRRVTEQGRYSSPEWRPDGRAMALLEGRAEVSGLVERQLDGRERLLVPTDGATTVARNVSWHPTENVLAYTWQTGEQHDIWIARIGDDEVVTEPLLNTAAREFSPRFSPDGHWLAYVASTGAASSVYVMAFPDGEPVAVGSGQSPRWSKTQSELFFVGIRDDIPTMLDVNVDGAGNEPVLGEIAPLFPMIAPNPDGTATVLAAGGNYGEAYDVLPDGRFLMIRRSNLAPPQEIAITRNWLSEIEGL